MRIVVAPDSFKECLPAREVAAVIADALRDALPGADVVECPLSDGGEGLLDVLAAAFGGERMYARVPDPLGRPVQAAYLLSGRTALVEVARACGLQLLSRDERNPLLASSRGVGELLLASWNAGARHFIVGLGGSATCDGGAGMLSVPRIRETLREASFEVFYDVDVPFCGPRGAARVFAPQKGASPADVEILEARMQEQARRLAAMGGHWASAGSDVGAGSLPGAGAAGGLFSVPGAGAAGGLFSVPGSGATGGLVGSGCGLDSVPGAGAAGGLGGAFAAAFGASLVRGIDRVLSLSGFDKAFEGASAVITGEGRSDHQTLSGKVPYGVLQHCRDRVPVLLLSGRIQDAPALRQAGFAILEEVSPADLPLDKALDPRVARHNLTLATKQILRKYLSKHL